MARIHTLSVTLQSIRPVLLLMSSRRMDCFMLCTKCLEQYTELAQFKKIYVLSTGCSSEHSVLIQSFQKRHDNVIVIEGNSFGGGNPLPAMLNIIMRRHAADPIVKLYEDVFVTPDWLPRLLSTYSKTRSNPRRAIVSALAPISRTGRPFMERLLRAHYPDERELFPDIPFLHNCIAHRFLWEKILHEQLTQKLLEQRNSEYILRPSLSTECVLFDAAFTRQLLPFPMERDDAPRPDEPHIVETLSRLSLQAAVNPHCLVHHFAHQSVEKELRKNISLDDLWWFMLFGKGGINPELHFHTLKAAPHHGKRHSSFKKPKLHLIR